MGCGNPCPDRSNCPPGVAPDFCIRRHDTKPPFRVNVEDCDGPLDLSGMVLEANMWTTAKLKRSIDAEATYFSLADDIGFDQIMIQDIIVMDRARSPEYMIVEGFDEHNRLVLVKRGHLGTTPQVWKKGQRMRIFRIMNGPAITEMAFEDVVEVDGTTLEDQIAASYLVYEWRPEDTCLSGCYYLEFKLLKMKSVVLYLPGGVWNGLVHQEDGTYFTGSQPTNSRVKLSYDGVSDRYLLPKNVVWGMSSHLWSDGLYYTGTDHDDGSVFLDTDGIPNGDEISYGTMSMSVDTDNEIPQPISVECNVGDISIISTGDISTPPPVSFTDVCSKPSEMGCLLGEGVEWVRRFPIEGEGFLIRITDSPTREF